MAFCVYCMVIPLLVNGWLGRQNDGNSSIISFFLTSSSDSHLSTPNHKGYRSPASDSGILRGAQGHHSTSTGSSSCPDTYLRPGRSHYPKDSAQYSHHHPAAWRSTAAALRTCPAQRLESITLSLSTLLNIILSWYSVYKINYTNSVSVSTLNCNIFNILCVDNS